MPLKAGDTFFMPDTGGSAKPGDRHLMACVFAPDKEGNILVVPFDSLHAKADQTCTLAVGEHAFVTRPSYVAYFAMKKVSASATDKHIANKYWIPDAPVTKDLLQRIRIGLLASKETEPWAKTYANKLGLPHLIKLNTPPPPAAP